MLEILLIDDSESDAKLIRRTAQRANVLNPIVHCPTGEEGLVHLETAADLPGLVLLDINMPGMNGYDVLRAIRGSDRTDIAALPVVFLTTSESPDEVVAAYRDSVNSYVVKPVDMAGFQKIMAGLSQYWFEIVALPHEDPAGPRS